MYYQPSENKTFTLHSDIRAAFPNISFPTIITDSMLEEVEVYPLVSTSVQYDPITQYLQEITPIQVNAEWMQQWEIHNYPLEQAESNLAVAKEQMLNSITAKRNIAEESGFMYMNKLIDSDSRAVQRITTAVQAAQVALATSAPFELSWMCADNTTLALDAEGMLGMSVALTMRGNTIHQNSRNLKAQVQACTNSTELAAVDINTGWEL